MKVENISQNNYSTNFKAIKSMKCEGLYKKFPEEGKKLIQTFKENAKAMEFCRKYDVDIVFNASEKNMNSVESILSIFYKNPAKNIFQRFSSWLFGGDNCIRIFGFGNNYNIKDSLKHSTRELNEMMTSQTMVTNKFYNPRKSGTLDSHVTMAEDNIEIELEMKHSRKLNKAKKEKPQNNYHKDSEELKNMMNEVIDSTK